MFDLGSWGEFLIIAVIALIVIKPEDIPNALKFAGRMLAKIRYFVSNLQISFEKVIQNIEQEELRKSIDELHKPINLDKARKRKNPNEQI